MKYYKNGYMAEFEQNGEITSLICGSDKYESNAIMSGGKGGFGRFVYTLKADKGTAVTRYADKGQSLILDDYYADASLLKSTKNSAVFKDEKHGAEIKYSFFEDCFTVTLDCQSTEELGSYGLSFNTDIIDTGTDKDYKRQYIPSFPYQNESGSLKLFGMERVDGLWLLFLPLTASAGWRIVYDVDNPHIITGFQFLKQFDERYGGEGADLSPLTVRVSFHNSFEDMLFTIKQITGTEIPISDCYGGMAGERIYSNLGAVKLKNNGLYTFETENGGSARYFTYNSLSDLFLRATDAIKKPYHCDFNLCEGAMWLWALLLRRKLFGTAGKNEYRFNDFLKENVYVKQDEVTDKDIGKIVSFPHEFNGKHYSEYHLYKCNRIQNAVVQGEVMLTAWQGYKDPDYLRLAKEYLGNLIRDHQSADGALRCDSCGDMDIDYSTVTACIFGFADLYRELSGLGDSEAESFKQAAEKMAEHLLKRGLNFPTEGTGGRKEMEEGSISCTALSLLYAYRYIMPKKEYLEFARELLILHDKWCMRVPDVAENGSTVRWWENNWEGDADGSSINAGHAWTIWKAEADYHYAYITADFDRLIRSYNGYLTSYSKVREDGRMNNCFTPDYLPSKPFKIKRGYPDLTDGSMAYYVWARSEETWFITSGIYADENGNHCINGRLNGELLETAAIELKRLFIKSFIGKIIINTDRPIEIIADKFDFEVIKGIKKDKREIMPMNGQIIVNGN